MHAVALGRGQERVFRSALGLAVGRLGRHRPVFVDAGIQRLAHGLDAGKGDETRHSGLARRLGQRAGGLEIDLAVAQRVGLAQRTKGMGVAGAVKNRVDAGTSRRKAGRVAQITLQFMGRTRGAACQHPEPHAVGLQGRHQPAADETSSAGDERQPLAQKASRRRR